MAKRGAADPVFLHFASFSHLSVHRSCTLQRQPRLNGDAEPYEELVRREAQRRGLAEPSAEFCQCHPFSDPPLDAAYHSVVNATSRARSTNDAEFVRLQQAAMKREARQSAKEKKPHTTACPPASAPTSTSITSESGEIALTEKERSALARLLEVASAGSPPCPGLDAGSAEAKPISQVHTHTRTQNYQATDTHTCVCTHTLIQSMAYAFHSIATDRVSVYGGCVRVVCKMEVQIVRYQNKHMLRRIRLYEAVFDRLGLEPPRAATSAAAHLTTEPSRNNNVDDGSNNMNNNNDNNLHSSKTKKRRKTERDQQYCEICAETPRRKKEVVIRLCGHAMCKTCVMQLRRVRNLHCPFCRISFSVPGDLQLLVPCKPSDLQ